MRRSASDLRAAGIDGVGSGGGEAGSSARLDGLHDGDDGENGSGDGYSSGDKGSGPNGTLDNLPRAIEIRGARVHNLRGIDLDVPLHRLVGIAGVSGSGKSSLALGILYAEGSRRYLEALSTYTRRRMTSGRRSGRGQASNTSLPRSRCTSGPPCRASAPPSGRRPSC